VGNVPCCRGSGEGGAYEANFREVPSWFSATPYAVGCNVQLLKSAISCRPSTGDGVKGDAAHSNIFPPNVEGHAASCDVRNDARVQEVFAGYSIATLVAELVLRASEECEGEQARRFAVVATPTNATSTSKVGAGVHADLVIVLLSPYVTLATNGLMAGHCDGLTDALKVMFTSDPVVMTTLGLGAQQVVLPAQRDREAVIQALQQSHKMLQPAARCVGALRVGYLPVAPTWN